MIIFYLFLTVLVITLRNDVAVVQEQSESKTRLHYLLNHQ